MRIRYTKDHKGRFIKQAVVYTPDEHHIDPNKIDVEAIKVARRLESSGHSAYVVGGAVRDLLRGKRPKDFDIATDAPPNRIRKLFRNSRVIGKRFKLVHVFFRDQTIEVSTFRAEESEGFQNIFGVIDEDVHRRDFTCNALYYSVSDQTVLDYVDGVKDIRKGVLRPVIPLQRIFQEDPVRMVRAVKYAVTNHLRIPFFVGLRIRKESGSLADISASRLTEEGFKIFGSGYCLEMMDQLKRYRLFEYLFPSLDLEAARRDIAALDEFVRNDGPVERRDMLIYLLADFVLTKSHASTARRISSADAYQEAKDMLKPVTPANRDVEKAVGHIIRSRKQYLDTGVMPRYKSRPGRDGGAAPHQGSGEGRGTRRRPRRRRNQRGDDIRQEG